MLPPPESGTYLATGTRKRSREQPIYLELSEGFDEDCFNLAKARELCVAHEDGQPKRSVYVSIYRLFEHVPLEALGNLWLATRDGRTLALEQAPAPPESEGRCYLYQELCPVHPLIASSPAPLSFCRFITSPDNNIALPAICFADLGLGALAEDPQQADAANLLYHDLPHLRDCLTELASGRKTTKTVNRTQPSHVPYRCIRSGFFAGDQTDVRHYPFPSAEELDRHHHEWWRSAALS